MGDIIQSLPILPAIRKAYPQARITWMARREFAPLLECVQDLDEVCVFDRKNMASWWYNPAAFSRLWVFIRSLRQARYDLILDLQGLLRSALFAYLSGCPVRIGLAEAREGARFLYTHPVKSPESPHVFDSYIQILSKIGVKVDTVEYKIHPSQADRLKALELLKLEEIEPKRFAVLIPGSAHPEKCWPADRFAAAAAWISSRFDLKIAAVGSASDSCAAEQIRRFSAVPVHNLCGKTTLPQLAALLDQAALMVGNDTGPAYLAAALDIPSVILFGYTNPARLFPYRKPQTVAAIEPFTRPPTIKSAEPIYQIRNVSLERVQERILAVFSESDLS